MIFLCSFLYIFVQNVNAHYYDEFLKWKTIEYDIPSSDYTALNNIPFGVTHHNDKLYITLPRRNSGIPSTLNYINIKAENTNQSPKLIPYPSYEVNQLHPNLQPDNKRIVSVYRSRTDACNRLWFIDTGLLQYPGNITRVQSPAVWIINLENDETIRRFEIPGSAIPDGRGLASLVVDVDSNNCDKAFAYIPDLFLFKIHVYSFETNRIWSFTHSYFYPDPLQSDFNVAGQKFQFRDGVFSIALSNKNADGFKTAYFHALASTSEFAVSTRILRNETNANRSYHGPDFRLLGNRGNAKQSSLHVFDPNTEIIFFAEINQYAITCWNTKNKLQHSNMDYILQNNVTLIYPSDLTIDSNGVLWTISNRIPTSIFSSLKPDEYNFRVFKIVANNAIQNTICN